MDLPLPLPNHDDIEMGIFRDLSEEGDDNFGLKSSEVDFFFHPHMSLDDAEADSAMLGFEDVGEAGPSMMLESKDDLSTDDWVANWLISPTQSMDFTSETDFGQGFGCDMSLCMQPTTTKALQDTENSLPSTSSQNGNCVDRKVSGLVWQPSLASVEESSTSGGQDCAGGTGDELEHHDPHSAGEGPVTSHGQVPYSSRSPQGTSGHADKGGSPDLVSLTVPIDQPGSTQSQTMPVILLVPRALVTNSSDMNTISQGQTPSLPSDVSALLSSDLFAVSASSSAGYIEAQIDQFDVQVMLDYLDSQTCEHGEASVAEAKQIAVSLTYPITEKNGNFSPVASETHHTETDQAGITAMDMQSVQGQAHDSPRQKGIGEFCASLKLDALDLPDDLENIDLCTPLKTKQVCESSGVADFSAGHLNEADTPALVNNGFEQYAVSGGNITPSFSAVATLPCISITSGNTSLDKNETLMSHNSAVHGLQHHLSFDQTHLFSESRGLGTGTVACALTTDDSCPPAITPLLDQSGNSGACGSAVSAAACLPSSCESLGDYFVPITALNQTGDQFVVLPAEESSKDQLVHFIDHQSDNSSVAIADEEKFSNQTDCGFTPVFIPSGFLSEYGEWLNVGIPQAHITNEGGDVFIPVSGDIDIDSPCTDSSLKNHVMFASTAVNSPCQDSPFSDGMTQHAVQLGSARDAFIPGHTQTYHHRREDSNMETSTDSTLTENQTQNTENSMPKSEWEEVEGPCVSSVPCSGQGKRKAKESNLKVLFPPRLGMHRSSEQEALQTPLHLHQFRGKVFIYPFDKENHLWSKTDICGMKTMDRIAAALAVQTECNAQSQMVREKIDRMQDARSVGKLKTRQGDFYCPPDYLRKRTVRQMLQEAGVPNVAAEETPRWLRSKLAHWNKTRESSSDKMSCSTICTEVPAKDARGSTSNKMPCSTIRTEVPAKDSEVGLKRKAADASCDTLPCKKARPVRQTGERDSSGDQIPVGEKLQADRSERWLCSETPCAGDNTPTEQQKKNVQLTEVSDDGRDDGVSAERGHVSNETTDSIEPDTFVSSETKAQKDTESVEQSVESVWKQKQVSSPSSQNGNGIQHISPMSTEENLDPAGPRSCEQNKNCNDHDKEEQESQNVQTVKLQYEDESSEHTKENKDGTVVQNKQEGSGRVMEKCEAAANNSFYQGNGEAEESCKLLHEEERCVKLQISGESTALAVGQERHENVCGLNERVNVCFEGGVSERMENQHSNHNDGNNQGTKHCNEDTWNNSPSNESMSEGSANIDSSHSDGNVQKESEHVNNNDPNHPAIECCHGSGLEGTGTMDDNDIGDRVKERNDGCTNGDLTEQNINQHDSSTGHFPEQVTTLLEGATPDKDLLNRDDMAVDCHPDKCSPRQAEDSCAWSLQATCVEDSTVIYQSGLDSVAIDPGELRESDMEDKKCLCNTGTAKEGKRRHCDVDSFPVVEKDGKFISSHAIHDGDIETLYQMPFILVVHGSVSDNPASEKDTHGNVTCEEQAQDRNSVTTVEELMGEEAEDGSIASLQNEENKESLENDIRVSEVFSIEPEIYSGLSSGSLTDAFSEDSVAESLQHVSTSSCLEGSAEIHLSSYARKGMDSALCSTANGIASVSVVQKDAADNWPVDDVSIPEITPESPVDDVSIPEITPESPVDDVSIPEIPPESLSTDSSVLESPGDMGQLNPAWPFISFGDLNSFDISQIVLPADLQQNMYDSIQGQASDAPWHEEPQTPNTFLLLDISPEQTCQVTGKSTMDKDCEGYTPHVEEMDPFGIWVQDLTDSNRQNIIQSKTSQIGSQEQYSDSKSVCSNTYANQVHIKEAEETVVLAESSEIKCGEGQTVQSGSDIWQQWVCDDHSPETAQSYVWGPVASEHDALACSQACTADSLKTQGGYEDSKADRISLNSDSSLDAFLQVLSQHADEFQCDSDQVHHLPPPPSIYNQHSHDDKCDRVQSHHLHPPPSKFTNEPVSFSSSCAKPFQPSTDDQRFLCETVCSSALGHNVYFPELVQFGSSVMSSLSSAYLNPFTSEDSAEFFSSGQTCIPYNPQARPFCDAGSEMDGFCSIDTKNTSVSGPKTCCCGTHLCGCKVNGSDSGGAVGLASSQTSHTDSLDGVFMDVVTAPNKDPLHVMSYRNMEDCYKDSISTDIGENCHEDSVSTQIGEDITGNIQAGKPFFTMLPVLFSDNSSSSFSELHQYISSPTSISGTHQHVISSPTSFIETVQPISSLTSFIETVQPISSPTSFIETVQPISSPTSISGTHQQVISSPTSFIETVQPISSPTSISGTHQQVISSPTDICETIQPISSGSAAVTCWETLAPFSTSLVTDNLSSVSCCEPGNTLLTASLSDLPVCAATTVETSLSSSPALISESLYAVTVSKDVSHVTNSLPAAPDQQKPAVKLELRLFFMEERSLSTVSQPTLPEVQREIASSAVALSLSAQFSHFGLQEMPVSVSSVCPEVTVPASQNEEKGLDHIFDTKPAGLSTEQSNRNVASYSSDMFTAADTAQFPTINMSAISANLFLEDQQKSSEQILSHYVSKSAKSLESLMSISNKECTKSSEQSFSESKQKSAKYSECDLSRSQKTRKSKSSELALVKTKKKSSKCSGHSSPKFESDSEASEHTVRETSERILSRSELKSWKLSASRPSKSKLKSSKMLSQPDQNKSKPKRASCKPKPRCSKSEEQSKPKSKPKKSSKKARCWKGASDDPPSVLSASAKLDAAVTTSSTATISLSSDLGPSLPARTRSSSRRARKGCPVSSSTSTESGKDAVTCNGRLSPLTVPALPPVMMWENSLPLTLSSTPVPKPGTSLKYVITPDHTNKYHPCPCHPLSVAVGRDRSGPPCLPFNPGFLSCRAMKAMPAVAACPQDLPQTPRWVRDDVYEYSPSAADIHAVQSLYSRCCNNPPDHHYRGCDVKFYISMLCIGDFTLNVEDEKYGKQSRVCFTFMKRMIWYKLELAQPVGEDGSGGQIVTVEMDMRSVVGVWGDDNTLLLELSAPPLTYIGDKWCRKRRQPFNISGGQMKTVPYHFLTFQSSCVRNLKKHLCEHPFFCHLLARPVTVDLRRTFCSGHSGHTGTRHGAGGVSTTSPRSSHCVRCKESPPEPERQCQVSEMHDPRSSEGHSVHSDCGQNQHTAEEESGMNQDTAEKESGMNQDNAEKESGMNQDTAEKESGMNQDNAEKESGMNQDNAEKESGMNQDNAEKESGMNQDNAEKESGMNQDNAEKESGMNQDSAEKESGMNQDNAEKESGMNQDNAEKESGMNQDNAEKESGMNLDNAEKESGMNQDNAEKESGMNQDNAEKESGMNQDNAEKESGMNQDNAEKESGMNQDNAEKYLGMNQDTAEEESRMNQDNAEEESGMNQDNAEEESGMNQDNAVKESGMNQDNAEEESGMNQDNAEEESGMNQDTAEKESGMNQDTAEEESGMNQDTAVKYLGMNQDTAEKESGMNQDNAEKESGMNQDNPVKESAMNQDNAVKESGMNQDTAEKESG